MMPGSGEDTLRTTGGQIDNIVFALIDASFDRNDNVTQAINTSIFNVGKHQPNLVLSTCHSYLARHPKLALAHKILILNVMEKICSEALSLVNRAVAIDLIKLAVEEMVNTKEILPEWQNVASGILVSLGRKYHNEVMEQLLTKFQPGVLPHFFIVQTMANLASANVFGMVPFLKAVLGTMLPLLCMVKHENMKWIFSYALARFCEAILEYIANAEKAPDPTVTKEAFVSEISSSYDVLFNNWLSSREAKVRSEVVVALGHMTHLLSPEKLEELLPKFVPAVLAIYKRHQEYQHTTQGLCMVLDAAVKNHSLVLESQLDSILNALFPQVCSIPDYSQPSGVRNHNEVLRCFAVLAPIYCNRIIAFLLQRLESNNETFRIGSLTVLKHLINSSDEHISCKIPLILSGLKPVLDSGNKVKKVIAQVIVTLAHHEYLKSDNGLDLVLFIINQCALPDDPIGKRTLDPTYVSNEALRAMCENVMHLLTTTVEKMENILWPSTLDCLVNENLTPAVGVICKSLSVLVSKKREESGSDFEIDYKVLANVTSAQILVSRLIVLLGHPFKGRDRGIHILKFLKGVSAAVHKSLKALWDVQIPTLIQCLEDKDPLDWNQNAWEDKLTDFVTQTLEEIDREEWSSKFAQALQSQLPLYSDESEDKYILLKILGLVMKKVSNKNFINSVLDTIFQGVNHSNALERQGCALAVGYCGSSHLDTVLVKLEQIAKDDKKSSGLFNFFKEFAGDSDHEKLKATIILCYGYVTKNGPIPVLSTRIETPILRGVASFYQSSKDIVVKQSMLETVKLIADAIHPDNLKEPFIFRSRLELLNLMKTILKAEVSMPLTNNIRALALTASAGLVALEPDLQIQEKSSLIQVAVSSVYSLPRDFLLQKPKEDGPDMNLDFDQLLISTVNALNFFLQKLLLKEKTFVNLESILQILHLWMTSKNAVERERCLHSTLHLLRTYSAAIGNESYAPFTTLGSVLGILVPRCTDPQVTVRHLAFDSIDTALGMKIQGKKNQDNNEVPLLYLKQQTISDDASSLFSVTKGLGNIISDKLPLEQIFPFLGSLIDGLCDPHAQSSSGTSVVLNTVIKCRGREIRQELPSVLEAVRMKLYDVQCPQTRKGTLLSIQHMANHNLLAILNSLLNSPLPMDLHTMEVWQTLCLDQSLANLIIEKFLELFSDNVLSSPPDPHGRSAYYIAAHKPLTAICALREMFKVPEMETCGRNHFDRIFSSICLVIGVYVGTVYNSDGKGSFLRFGRKSDDQKSSNISPVRCAIEALRAFLTCVSQEVVVSSMTEGGYWVMMEEADKYPDAVAALGRAMCVCCPAHVPKIVTCLNPMISSSVDAHRIVSVSLFVEFLTQSYNGRHSLTEPLINSMLGRLVDSSSAVRRLSIRGLGNIAMLDKEQVERYSTTMLSAMMTGMDDSDDPECDITLESMSGLSSVLAQIAEEDVRNILINISLRIKPMFEKDKPLVRAAAFTLFGNLSRFGESSSKEQFLEQIHNNLVPLLLHLNDDDKRVIKACKYSLRLLGPLIESKEMNDMFQKHLLDDAHLHYGEFLNDLTKTVISDLDEKISFYITTCMSYLKSQFPVIQCNAIAFIGYLLGNLPAEKHHLIPKERICSALLTSLKDQTPEVRIRAADALSLLYDY